MISITGISTVAVPAADQDRAIEFYVGTLGFTKVRDDTFGNGMRWIEVVPTAGGTTIALAPADDVKPGVDTGIRLLTADADATHASLIAAGADVNGEVLRWPGVPPMFSLRDPDGNTLYVVETT
jgi:predicted enzyme related to lactoylglutathione lyase